MPDYGQPLRFGYVLIPDAADIEGMLRLARLADGLGLDLIGIPDHPYQRHVLETWTVLTAIAMQTQHIRIFPDVANLPLRPPAMLAKAAASLDLLSGGRFELGLGAGGYWEAIATMGGPQRSPREALAALEEALTVLRLMWSNQRVVQFAGQYYQLDGVAPQPRPARPIGVWIGAVGPKMLELIGRRADGWIPSSPHVPPERLPELQRLVDAGIQRSGRKATDVRRIYNIVGRIRDNYSRSFLDGPVEQWVDELTALTLEQGMDTYILSPAGDPTKQLTRFANEVVPGVREQVAKARNQAS